MTTKMRLLTDPVTLRDDYYDPLLVRCKDHSYGYCSDDVEGDYDGCCNDDVHSVLPCASLGCLNSNVSVGDKPPQGRISRRKKILQRKKCCGEYFHMLSYYFFHFYWFLPRNTIGLKESFQISFNYLNGYL